MLNKILWLWVVVVGLWFAFGHKPAAHPVAPAASVGVPAGNVGAITPSARFPIRPATPASTSAADLVQQVEAMRDSVNPEQGLARESALTNLLLQLVRVDAAAAGRLAETLGLEAGRDAALRTVAQAWADQDATGALVWAAQLPDPNEKQAAQANVVFQLAQSDPVKAVTVAQQLNLEGGYDLLPTLAVQWASRDWDAAQAWAQSLPAGDQRDQIMARMAFVESQTAPVAAGNRVLTEIPPGAVQDEAVMTVLHQWSLTDMPGAQAWVRAFPESPIKDRALSELVVVDRR